MSLGPNDDGIHAENHPAPLDDISSPQDKAVRHSKIMHLDVVYDDQLEVSCNNYIRVTEAP